jgi:hypothetical protein
MSIEISVIAHAEATLVAPAIAAGGGNLDPMCQHFASLRAGEAEALIDAYVVQAIGEWRVTDATFWQRVKFRSRMLRAAARHQQAIG